MKRIPLSILAIILWLGGIAFGLTKLYHYEFGSNKEGQHAQYWPLAATIKFQKGILNYVLVIHPHCACSRATLGELEIIMAHNQGKVATTLLFIKPKKFDTEWVKTDLYDRAVQIPGVEVYIDDEGKQAALFGGTTSGEGFLYDEQGSLIFFGGITASRGHAGDNVGRATIDDLINHRKNKISHTKSFGCSLVDKHKE